MDKKKSVAVSICAVLSILLFAIVGSCFIAYKYSDEKVFVENPKLILGSGVVVKSEDDKPITNLEFSKLKLGLKPVTGDLDKETAVPVTVTDQNGSEGIYAKFKVVASENKTIKVNNLKIEGNESLDTKKERVNIWMSIKEIQNSTKNFEDDEVVLGSLTDLAEGKTFTILFWLGSIASDDFNSCTITFDVVIE